MMIMIIISLLILSVFFAGILLYFFPKPPVRITGRRYDAAIVLGCPCQNDGSLSPMQQRRMNKAIDLYKQQAYHLLIVSGGCVINQYGEAAQMCAYAQQQTDVPFIVEDQARNTYENFVYSADICRQKKCESIIIVTSPFHMRRANYFAKRYFHDYCICTYREHDRAKNWPIEWYCMCKCLWIEAKLKRKKKKSIS